MNLHRFTEHTPVIDMTTAEFFCPQCQEEPWSCECIPLPTYEQVRDNPEILKVRNHDGNRR